MARRHKPKIIVETGVAAGSSSRVLLQAIKANGFGHLYSTDLSYDDRPGVSRKGRPHLPAAHVGLMVDDEHRDCWTLLRGSDREGLPQILANVDKIDLVHYDSDKSYEGRAFALGLLLDRIADDGLLLMDDIRGNLFFRDFARESELRTLAVRARNKAIGIVLKPRASL